MNKAELRRRHLFLLTPHLNLGFVKEAHDGIAAMSDAEYASEVDRMELVIKREIVRSLLMARNPAVPLMQPEIDEILRQARAEEGMFDVPAYREDLSNILPKPPETNMGEHTPVTCPDKPDFIITQDGTKIAKA